jgi:hypothetical protein
MLGTIFTIKPNITSIFVSGTVPTLSLQLVAIGYEVWKLLDIVKSIRNWSVDNKSEQETPIMISEN